MASVIRIVEGGVPHRHDLVNRLVVVGPDIAQGFSRFAVLIEKVDDTGGGGMGGMEDLMGGFGGPGKGGPKLPF